MRRATVLVALLALGGLSFGVAAYQQPPAGAAAPPAAKVINVEKVKDNFYVLRGGGGNTAVFITAEGVTVVDAKNPGWGQPLLDKIKELTPKPVVRLINTHSHFDHTSGNVEFPATVEIIAHQNTKANIERWAPLQVPGITQPDSPFKANPGKGLPSKLFKDKMSVGKGDDKVELFYFGRGHTNGDAWVVFPSLHIVHSGDIFAGKNLPILDAVNGGSGVAIPDSLTKAADALTKMKVDTIVNGHTPANTTVADLREYAAFNKEFLAAVRDGKKAGKSVDDIAGAWKTPASYSGYPTPQPARLKGNVQVIFDELK